jgi:hypothetical protein
LIEDILSRLDKVKRTGRGNWLARCPSHDDGGPSLTIRAEDDGRILVHCFAGCSFEEIKDAVGLGWEPWFPQKQKDDFKPAIRRPFPAADVLEAVASEAAIVAVSAANIALGVPLTDEDRARVWEANCRIQNARDIANGVRS